MTIMMLGIMFFFGTHLLPRISLRQRLIERIGFAAYKGLFVLISFIGLGCMVWGYNIAALYPLWFFPYAYPLAYAVMPFAMICIVASHRPCNLASMLPHPLLTGFFLWSAVHLAANGDLGSLFIFGSFFLYSLGYILFVKPKAVKKQAYTWQQDAVVVVIGIGVYLVLIHTHRYFAGVALPFPSLFYLS